MPHDPLAWIDDQLRGLQERGLRRRLVERTAPQGPQTEIDGRPLVNFGSNDYLGLAGSLGELTKQRLQSAFGAGASPLITGRSELHARLERELAELKQTEAALLFPTGYAANVGAVASLVGRGDAVFSDAKNHASIIDGCRLSRAEVFVYPHLDVSELERRLQQAGDFRRRLIATDSLFSMDGDIAPLPELAELARRYDAMLLADEAHATGVFGETGSGLCQHFAVERGVHVRVGTLSKALGSHGGFVAGRRSLIEWLTNRARSYVFSTAAPDPVAAAGLESLRIVREEPHRRVELLALAAALRQRLQADGWEVGESASQIIPVLVGQPEAAVALSRRLLERGILAPAIRPPTVPHGESLLRISLCYGHTAEDCDRLVAALAESR